ncbi:hypothetical protein BDZ89DRAFT_1123096 [Hymenopellis radicata]|nr:hypothetical protein BDZ89DRAFT_1123096 [Hymenopellis radicata]
MSLLLQNISTRASFASPKDLTLLPSKDLFLDNYEYCWGLKRGELNPYLKGSANHIRVQPSMKAALTAGRIILLPSEEIITALAELQASNGRSRLEDREMFLQKMPFGVYQYRVITLASGITLFSRDPSTKRVCALNKKSPPIVSCNLHPFFVIAHASNAIGDYRETMDPKLYGTLTGISIAWAPRPYLEFYVGSYEGEFGRPGSLRNLRRKYPPISPPPSFTDSNSTLDSDSDRDSKRSRSSSPDTEPEGIDICAWVARCNRTAFETPVDHAAEVGDYASEVARSLEDVMSVRRDAMKEAAAPQSRNPKRKRV